MWTAFDFALAGGVLVGLGFCAALIFRFGRSLPGRAGLALMAVTGALVSAASGAVGLIGAETNAANGFYLGLVALVAVGAIAVRFRASGMALVALTAAVGQIGIAAAATALGALTPSGEAPLWAFKTWAVTGVFAALWGGAALAFLAAARQEGQPSRIG